MFELKNAIDFLNKNIYLNKKYFYLKVNIFCSKSIRNC